MAQAEPASPHFPTAPPAEDTEATYDDVNGWTLPLLERRIRRLTPPLDTKQIDVPCTLNGEKMHSILDTGSHVTAVSVDWARKHGLKVSPEAGRLGTLDPYVSLPTIGKAHGLTLSLGSKKITLSAEVQRMRPDETLLLGMDVWDKLGLRIEITSKPLTMPLKSTSKPLTIHLNSTLSSLPPATTRRNTVYRRRFANPI